jgi:DNA-binding MarR family transcriptional regulator
VNQKLDDIRAELDAALEAADQKIEGLHAALLEAERDRETIRSGLRLYERTVEAMSTSEIPSHSEPKQRQPVQRMVLEYLGVTLREGEPAKTAATIADETGIDEASVRRVLKRLVSAGKVTQEGDRYRLATLLDGVERIREANRDGKLIEPGTSADDMLALRGDGEQPGEQQREAAE